MSRLPRILCVLFVHSCSRCVNKRKISGLNYSKAITFGMPAGRVVCQCGGPGCSCETPRQVLWQINPKNSQTERNYMICIPHQARLVLPLIIYSWVHCTQLCIIHQAFLSTEQVFLIHTRHHFKLTRMAFLPELQPLIGHFRHSNHRQQQEHGTQVCRRIRITS